MPDGAIETKAGPVSKIEIANNDEGAIGFEVAGKRGFVEKALKKLGNLLGKDATLRDIADLAESGTTASSVKK